jgi:hypothetical protein
LPTPCAVSSPNAAIGDHAIAAIAWSVGLGLAGYVWSLRQYNRRRAAEPK